MRLVFAFLVLWGFCPSWGVRLIPWVAVVSVFVFWRSGASAHVEVSIWFFVWAFCPSVVSLFFLVAVVGIVLCCWSLLLVFLFWRPVASARALGCFCFGGWGWCFCWLVFWGLACPGRWRLSFGALGLLPALWCSSSSLGWLWFGVGVCLSALWGFRPVWGIYLPFSRCGWRAWASACFAVFLFPFGCCGGHLSFGAGSLLVPSARSIFSFSSLGHLKLARRTCNDAWFVS